METLFNEITKDYTKTESKFILEPFLKVLETDTLDDLIINGAYFIIKASSFMGKIIIKTVNNIDIEINNRKDKSIYKIFTRDNITKYNLPMIASCDLLKIISINRSLNIVILVDVIVNNQDSNDVNITDIKSIIEESNTHGFLFVFYGRYDYTMSFESLFTNLNGTEITYFHDYECNDKFIKSFITDMKNGFDVYNNLIRVVQQYKSDKENYANITV